LAEVGLVWCAPAERLMRTALIIQGDEITLIRPRNWRSSTRGIHGSGAPFISMR